MTSLLFLILAIDVFFLLFWLAWLEVFLIFWKNQFLVSLISFKSCLSSILLISTLVFIISFSYACFRFMFFFFSPFPKVKTWIIDVRCFFFSNTCIQWYIFSSMHCFCYIQCFDSLYFHLASNIFLKIYVENSSLNCVLLGTMFNFQVFGNSSSYLYVIDL